ncbi:MAG: ribosome assembly cofactor RimP [Bacteroidales bacterium]|nr:ribosome assembly cofactor RimP [Bacteroidales bacterium]MDY2917404.1 ribosome assembly cofactor RimP [Muribaculaceae bacterium]
MIDKEKLVQTVKEAMAGTDLFLVAVDIRPDNAITVTVDSPTGVDIDECVAITRTVEAAFDRDVEDYELEVGSAGVTAPFSVPEQYRMNVGNPVDILTRDGQRLHATLAAVSDDASVITVTVPTKVREEGAKRPKIVDVPRDIPVADIKSIVREIVF